MSKNILIKKSTFGKFAIFFLVLIITIFTLLVFSSTLSFAKPMHAINHEQTSKYASIVDKIHNEGSVNVIVRVKDISNNLPNSNSINKNSKLKSTNSKSRTNVLIQVENSGFVKEKDLPSIDGYSGRMDSSTLDYILSNNIPVEIYENRIFHIMIIDEQITSPSNTTSYSTESTLSTANSVIGADLSNIYNLTGKNVTVAVIDTGIYYNHSDLGGCFITNGTRPCRVIGGYNFYNNTSDPMDDNGHGTHVAGIIGANGTIIGVAPEVNFLAVKVCSSDGICDESTIIQGINYAVSNNASIISMSLGGSVATTPYGNSGFSPLDLAIENATNSGVIAVISAGNDGPGISTLASPGSSKDAITVGAIDDSNTVSRLDDTIASFSSRGPSGFGRLDPDISAPGVSIVSTASNYSLGCTHCSTSGYTALSGTSMAQPFVAGSVALLVQNYRNNLNNNSAILSSKLARQKLMNNAYNITGSVYATGSGGLDIYNALFANSKISVNYTNEYFSNIDTDRIEIMAIPGIDYSTYNNSDPYINDTAIIVINLTFVCNYSMNYNLETGYTPSIYTFNSCNFTTIIPELTGFDGVILNSSKDSNNNLGYNFTIAHSLNLQNNSLTILPLTIVINNVSLQNPGTYGGTLRFISSNANNLSMPIVLTIPVFYDGNINRTLTTAGQSGNNGAKGDMFMFAYYNKNSENNNRFIDFNLSWISSTNDLDLYVHDSLGESINYSQQSATISEFVSTNQSSIIKWIRVQGWDTSVPLNFNVKITDIANIAPIIINISSNESIITPNSSILVLRNTNATFKITYSDPNNDSMILSINDSRFILINTTYDSSSSVYSKTFSMATNVSLIGNYPVTFNLTDLYHLSVYSSFNVRIYAPLSIDNYAPNSSRIVIKANSSIQINITSSDLEFRNLSHKFYINNTLNYSINTTSGSNVVFNITTLGMSNNYYDLLYAVTNNETTSTLNFNLTIDRTSPTITFVKVSNNSIINNVIINDSLDRKSTRLNSSH